MLSHNLLLALPACLGAGSMLTLALIAFFSSSRASSRAFTAFCLAVFVWCLGAAAEEFSTSLAARVLWAKLGHFGVAGVGPAWFVFCGFYTGTLRRPLRRLWLLALVPLASLVLVLTNEQHDLIWSKVRWDGVNADFVHGWWFSYIYLPYGYLLVGLGSLRLVRSWFSASASYRTSLLLLSVSSLLPLAGNLIYFLSASPVPLDPTPIGFALSGMLVAWMMVRHRFLQREPIPLQLLLQRLPDAVLLLDLKGRVLEANLAATELFGPRFRGVPVAKLAPELAGLEEGLAAALYHRGGQHYQVQCEPLVREGDTQVARLLTLRDVSVYVGATEQLEQQATFQEALLESVRGLLDADVGPDIYQLVLEQALQVIPGAEAGTVVLQQPDGLFSYVASVGFDLEILSRVRFERRELFYGERLFDGPTLTTELDSFNAQMLAPEKLELVKRAGFGVHYRVSMGVPVFLDGELLAVLSLDNATDSDAFGQSTKRLAEVFAKHIGAALQKARFERQLERAMRAQTLLARVERLLLQTTELDRFFPLLVEELVATEGLPVDQLIVYKLQGQHGEAFVYAGDRQREVKVAAEIREVSLLEQRPIHGHKVWSPTGGPTFLYREDVWQVESWVRLESNPSRSILYCPLLRGGSLWGVLEYASDTPRAFDEATRDLLLSIAQSTELALTREYDRNKLELELSRMNTVVSSGEAMRTLNTRQQVFEEAVAAVVGRTQADLSILFWYSADTDNLEPEASLRTSGETLDAGTNPVYPSPRSQELGWQVMGRDATLRVNDAELLEHAFSQYRARFRPQDYIGTPLRDADNRPLGVLAAYKSGEGTGFEASDVAFLEAIAQAGSAALIRLNLLSEAEARASAYRELYRTAERQHQELALLDRVRTALARELNLDRVAQTLVTALSETLGYAAVRVFWLEEGVFSLRAGTEPEASREGSQQDLLARVVREARPALSEVRQAGTNDVRPFWEIVVPLYGQEKIVGVLSVQSFPGLELGEADLKLLSALGEQASIAVERAVLYSYVQGSEERFRLLAENMSDLVCLHAADGRLRYVSPSSEVVLGVAPEALLGQMMTEYIHPEDLAAVSRRMTDLAGADGTSALRARLRRQGGEYRWFESVTHPLYDAEGTLQGFTSSSRDVTERQAMEERLRYGAHYDSLTNLPNRTLFLERLQRALETGSPEGQTAVLFIDLDRFKVVNDSLGHQAGDVLLKKLSVRLLEHVRPGDMVARLSGDEFCVLLEHLEDTENALQIVARLQHEVGAPFVLEGRECFISASIGIAFAAREQRAEDLLRNADIAMYRAKHGGRDAYVVFDESMYQAMVDRLTLESDLRHALERSELSLHYQPIFNLQTGLLIGFEALSRWTRAGKAVPPDLFIPVAEETGLIIRLDTWALREACRQLASWQQTFDLPPSLSVSVNLASVSFEQADLLTTLHQTLAETGLPASCLTLELTERTVMRDGAEGISVLRALRQLGVRVQVDDFGTGYSSLRYLHTLPLDSLKIDRSFITQLETGQSRMVVRSILALAQELNLQVVAEGIETPEQLGELKALACDYGQGYLLSRPLAPAQLEETLLRRPLWLGGKGKAAKPVPFRLIN